jgi:hypothetical protein
MCSIILGKSGECLPIFINNYVHCDKAVRKVKYMTSKQISSLNVFSLVFSMTMIF